MPSSGGLWSLCWEGLESHRSSLTLAYLRARRPCTSTQWPPSGHAELASPHGVWECVWPTGQLLLLKCVGSEEKMGHLHHSRVHHTV